MGRLLQIKKRADSVLAEVFRTLFEEIDTEKIRREVSTLKESAPDFEPVDHARTLVRRTAIRCAAAGAMSGLPSGLIALGTLGADLAYLMFQQFRLIIGIATIYGHDASHRERFGEARALDVFNGRRLAGGEFKQRVVLGHPLARQVLSLRGDFAPGGQRLQHRQPSG